MVLVGARRRLMATMGLVLVAMLAARGADAQSSSTSASMSSSGSGDEIDSQVKAWLENYLEDGESRLFPNDIKSVWGSTIGSSLTANWKALPVVCDSMPSIQTKSSTLTPNGGCPDVYTSAGVSCTCLEGYNGTTDWTFRVAARGDLTARPLTQNAGDVLEITSMVTLVAPSDLVSVYVSRPSSSWSQ